MLKSIRAWRERRRDQAEFERYWQTTVGSELVRTISTMTLIELNSPVLERPCRALSASDDKLLRNAYAVALLSIINKIVVAEHPKEVGNNIISAVVINLSRWPHFDRAMVQKMSDGAPLVLNRMWERRAPSLQFPNGTASPAAAIALLPGSVGLPFSAPFVPDPQMTIESLHSLAAFRDSLPRNTSSRLK